VNSHQGLALSPRVPRSTEPPGAPRGTPARSRVRPEGGRRLTVTGPTVRSPGERARDRGAARERRLALGNGRRGSAVAAVRRSPHAPPLACRPGASPLSLLGVLERPGRAASYLVGRPLATDPLAEPRAAALVAGPRARARWPSRSCAGKSKSTQLTVAGLTAGVGEPPQTGVGREFVRKPGQAAAASGDGALGAGRRLGRAAGRVGRCGSGR
jgi:hypothetical protein